MGYWAEIEPYWRAISIYGGPETFLKQFVLVPEHVQRLFAAHWLQSEVCNGGFHQFFANSSGILAPEAAEAFKKIGMPQVAAIVLEAMTRLAAEYPRDRNERRAVLDALTGGPDVIRAEGKDPFGDLDDRFFSVLASEAGGWDAAADAYAARFANQGES